MNNLPLYILLGGLCIFLTIMAFVAWDRASERIGTSKGPDNGAGGDTSMFAKALVGEQKDGIVKAKAPPPPPAPTFPNAVAIARPENLDHPPMPPGMQAQQPSLAAGAEVQVQRDDEASRIRMLKLQQFDEAVRAKTAISLASMRGAPSSTAASNQVSRGMPPSSRDEAVARLAEVRQQIDASLRDDPGAAFKARLQMAQTAGNGLPGASGTTGESRKASAGRNDLAQFAGSGSEDRWQLDSSPKSPRTPYELRAGYVIPAILISGINSELPGQIVAQVSQDVFDTPLGKHKLVPQGSRLVGSYASDVAYGQSRVLVAWQRIIFPDGKAMDIGAMPGADGAGYAGFTDKVNNHYFRVFSSAFLMSAVTAGIAVSQPERGTYNARPTTSSALSEALGQQLGQVTTQLIAKNLNISPTLEIRPGYRFNVIVTKDLTFTKPYAAFDY